MKNLDAQAEYEKIKDFLKDEEFNGNIEEDVRKKVQERFQLLFTYVHQIQRENDGLRDSLNIYKEDLETHETSTHQDVFHYEFNVNEKGEIPCLLTIHGVEHSFGITEKDVETFLFLFRMKK